MQVILNGELLPAGEAMVSVQDRGFRFGDGLFETIAVYDGVPYQFGWHMARLSDGLAALKIRFDHSKLRAQAAKLLKENDLLNGTLRIQITRGSGGQGYLPDAKNPTCLIECAPRAKRQEGQITLFLSTLRKPSPASLPVQYKICQGLNSTLARMEAAEHGCFEALLLSDSGMICETSSANIFWVAGGELFTPSLSCGALGGSTRAVLRRLSPVRMHEVSAPIQTLEHASAVFITNSAWQVLPVARLEPLGFEWQGLDIIQTFSDLLHKDIEDYCRDNQTQWT